MDHVRIGIIGTGFSRLTQIPAFRLVEGARITAIASGHRQNAERVAAEFEIPNVLDDWLGVVEDPDVDLVSIVSPPSTHAEILLASLAAGKRVLCEKPTAMNVDEALRMRRAVEEAGCLAVIDHELRFMSNRARMRQMIHAGEIGSIHHLQYQFRTDTRANAERARWNWWADVRHGGGVFGAIGSHGLDAMMWILEAPVRRIAASLATHVRERVDATQPGTVRPVTTDDEATVLVRFRPTQHGPAPTGTILLSTTESGEYRHTIEAFGDRGALRADADGSLWRADVGGGRWNRVELPRQEAAPNTRDSEWDRGFLELARLLIPAVSRGESSVPGAATFDDGVRIQMALDAGRRSSEEECWVEIDE